MANLKSKMLEILSNYSSLKAIFIYLISNGINSTFIFSTILFSNSFLSFQQIRIYHKTRIFDSFMFSSCIPIPIYCNDIFFFFSLVLIAKDPHYNPGVLLKTNFLLFWIQIVTTFLLKFNSGIISELLKWKIND